MSIVDQPELGSRLFESLAAAVDRRELSLDGALTIAAAHPEALSDTAHVDTLVSRAREALDAERPIESLLLLDLTVAGLAARPGHAASDEVGRSTRLLFADIARGRLISVADGRLFRRALAAAEAVLAWARTASDTRALAEALFQLGRLRLDPWIAGRRIFEPEREIGLWEAEFRIRYRDEIADLDEKEWRMPPALDTARAATSALEEAAGLQTGTERARTIVSWAAAEVLQLALGEEIDRPALVARCREAIGLLERTDYAPELADALGYLTWLEEPVRREQLDGLLSRSLDDQVQRSGWTATAGVMTQVVAALAPADPASALEVARSARIVFQLESPDDDSLRQTYLRNEFELLIKVYRQAEDASLVSGPDIAAGATALRAAAEREHWDVRRLAVNLLALARRREATESADGIGLALFEECGELAPVLAWDYDDAFRLQHARLLVTSGRAAGQAGAWDKAAERFVRAVHVSVEHGLRREALAAVSALAETFTRMDDAVDPGPVPVDAVRTVALELSRAALALEDWLGVEAGDLLRSISRDAIAVLARRLDDEETPLLVVPLLQMAKGMRFALQLHTGSHDSWRADDDRGAMLLDEIAREEAGAVEPVVPEGATEIDERLLLSYVSADARPSGGSGERLANLRQAYDAHLNERLRPEVALKLPLLTAGVLRGMLDERTVLVNLFLDAKPGAELGVVAVAVTAGEVVPTVQRLGVPYEVQVAAAARGRSFPASPFAPQVAALRAELHSPPEPDALTAAAAKALASDGNLFLGGLTEDLSRWGEAGKDHICICPHGPLHMYPLHLCGMGSPLAEEWIVTYLPNLFMVAPRGSDALIHRPRTAMCSLGLSYTTSNPFGLAELPAAVDEAREVGALFDCEPVLEDDVTERAVLGAFGTAECVHLAAHGRHNVDAPAFQCLYLSPGPGSDGRLEAHELLSTDMRGTRILTLSACETALGRFDAADNLRGLPACFLLAGVRTIIGTLWPVDTDASRLFFTRFYSGVREGVELLDAFAAAQDATRKQFPAYRDWGPFYFMGDWY